MEPQPPMTSEADFAQTLQELTRGEQTASAMENRLDALEQKIDALLASAESQSTSNAAHQDGPQDSDRSKVAVQK